MDGRRKVAVVVGGSSGPGRNIVTGLARQGVRTVFTFDTGRDDAFWVAVEATGLGCQAIPLEIHLEQLDDGADLAERTGRALAQLHATKIDYLVLTPAYSELKQTMGEAEIDRLDRIDLRSALFLTKALLPLIGDRGRIIHRSSSLDRFIAPGSPSFVLLKHAAEALAQAVANDFRPRRIAVDCVSPRLGTADVDLLLSDVSGMADRTEGDSADLVDPLRLMIISLLAGEGGLPDLKRIEVSKDLSFWVGPRVSEGHR